MDKIEILIKTKIIILTIVFQGVYCQSKLIRLNNFTF